MNIKEFVNEFKAYESQPDVQAFLRKSKEKVGREDIPDEVILDAYLESVFKDWEVIDTLEFKKTRNWVSAFSLVFWTELEDGAEDYTVWEKEFMMMFYKYMVTKYPDLDKYLDTRLYGLPNMN